MPATQEDYSKIKTLADQAAAKNYEAAGMLGLSGDAQGNNSVLGDQVMQAVREDRQARGVSKLATDVGNVMGQMVTDPNAIREGPQSLSAQGLVDPFSINALTSNARAQNLQTLGTISTQELANQGSLDQIIQAGANQLKARASMLLAQAEQDLANADSIQKEWERDFAEKELSQKNAGSGKAGGGYNADGTPDYEGMQSYALGLLGTRFANDPIKDNVNAWDAMFTLVKQVYPWVTEADIMNITGSPRPSSAPIATPTKSGGFFSGLKLFGQKEPQTPLDRVNAELEQKRLLNSIGGNYIPTDVPKTTTNEKITWELDAEGNLVPKKK